ncbi:MAG: serine hydrolase domain-containing protein [Desulfobacterales bacterium]
MINVEREGIENAGEVGLDPDRLSRLTQSVVEDTGKGLYDGAVFAVGRYGKLVLHEAVGHAEKASERAAKRDDVFMIMSITKTFTAGAVFSFIEKGRVELTTTIADVIPEFGIKGKQRVTVAHLMTHTGGMSVDLPAMLPVEQVGDLQAYVAAACNEPLKSRPGSRVSYSPLTAHAVLAEMVRRLDGGTRPFRQILAEELFEPLKMKDTSLGVRKDLEARRVPIVVRDKTPGLFDPLLLGAMNDLITEETEIPAGGAASTALDLFRWAEMLRNGGELDGIRVLSPGLLKLAVTNHTGDMPNDVFDHAREIHGWDPFPAYLGLSFFLRGKGIFAMPFGQTTSERTFGGLGAGSTMFWVDPERELTFVLLTSGLLEEGASFLRHQKLSDLLVASVVD